MTTSRLSPLRLAIVPLGLLMSVGLGSFTPTASAQTDAVQPTSSQRPDRLPPGKRHGRHIAARASVDFRGLTINKRPPSGLEQAPGDDEDDVLVDGPIRYGRITTFDPAPYVDSGQQYPFGFDGIGGFGSDLGFQGGSDTALYQRGP